MYSTKYTLQAIFSLSLLVSLSAFADEPSIIEQVLGQKPLSSATTELVNGVGAIKDGVVSFGQSIWDGTGRWLSWGKDLCQDNGPKIGRVGYQLAKVVAGWYGLRNPLPAHLFVEEDRIVVNQDRVRVKDQTTFETLALNAPTRVLGLALLWHALQGLLREAGFDDIKDLYRSAEGLNNSDLN